MANRRALRWMMVAALAAGCAPAPATSVSEPIAELPGKVAPAASPDAAGATLALSVVTEPSRGYRTQYVNILDWEVADGTLTNTDPTIPSLNRTAAATVDAQLARKATLMFAPVKATGNYTLQISLKRRDRAGTYQVIATGTKASFSLSPGANTATVTLTPTANGQLAVSVPQPAPSFVPPPILSAAGPMTGSVGMLVTFSGINFGATTGANTISFNGTSATVTSASTTSVDAQVPNAATTGPLTLQTVSSWPAVSAGTYTVVASGTSLGAYGVGASPYGMAVDTSGNLWVCNSGGTTVSKLGPDGTLLATYPVGASAPFAIAFDGSGNAWITTYTTPGNVVRMAPDGTILGTTSVGTNPVGIEFDPSGNAWVSNYGDNTVSKLTPTGAFIANYSIGVNPSQASGLAIDSSGNVWVGIYNRARVVKLAPNGSTLGTFVVGNNPASLAFDAGGNLWVTMEGDNRLYKMASDGTVMANYAAGTGPRGLAIDAFGNPWVCNVGTNQVTKMSSTGLILGAYPVGIRPNKLVFDRSRAAWVSINNTNNVVKLAL
jgi:sugar lactone lactonase YvrE